MAYEKGSKYGGSTTKKKTNEDNPYAQKMKSDWERGEQVKKSGQLDTYRQKKTTKESRLDDASMPAYAQKQKSDWERGQGTKRKSTQSSKSPLSYEEKQKADWQRGEEVKKSGQLDNYHRKLTAKEGYLDKGTNFNRDRIAENKTSGIKETKKGNIKQVTGVRQSASYAPTQADAKKAQQKASQQGAKQARSAAGDYATNALKKGFAQARKGRR
jgi:hypothetical protein